MLQLFILSLYSCLCSCTGMDDLEDDADDSPLAIFKLSLETSPEMRDYFEMATHSEEKISLFDTGI